MRFFKAVKEKFERGAQEHGPGFNKEKINAVKEIKEELEDIYNYAELLENEELKQELQGLANYYWKRLEYVEK